MTTASEAIIAAYRESNLVIVGGTPTDAELTEGLARLNGILPATVGMEIGTELIDVTIGGSYDQSFVLAESVPENARLVLNLAAAQTVNLHPYPYDGQRLAIVDAGGTLATNNLTLDANGRKIEGAASLTLSTNGQAREWIYRADTAEWTLLSELELADTMPFPREFDDYFAILLAMRLNPRHGRELQQGSAIWLADMKQRLQARYRRPRDQQEWASLGLYGQQGRAFGSSTAAFGRGRP